MKWVAKSVLSALDLEQMDSEDKKDIIRTIKKKKEEGSDEEFDFMDDEKGTMSLPIMTYMSDDMVDWGALSDEEKAQALKNHAAARGMKLPDEVIDYCLRYLRRDLPNLMATLEALDEWSLTEKKAVTVPLLRKLLQLPLNI